jgi:hypothetical protein
MPVQRTLRRRLFRHALLAMLALNSSFLFAQVRPGTQPARQVPAQQASVRNDVKPDPNTTVAAIVNGKPITIAELAQQCRIRYGNEVLDDMVNKTLLMQACLAQKIIIEDKDVNNEIARTAAQFRLTTAQFVKVIEDERDISREQYAEDVVWPMLAMRALSKDTIVVSPQEVDREFQSQYGPKVKVRMIACKDANKIAQIHKQVTADPDSFKKMAKDHSEDPDSASVEGLLPPIRRNLGDDELESIAFSLQPNQVSKIFQAGEMNVILQCSSNARDSSTYQNGARSPQVEAIGRKGFHDHPRKEPVHRRSWQSTIGSSVSRRGRDRQRSSYPDGQV